MKRSKTLSTLCLIFSVIFITNCGGGRGLIKKRIQTKPSISVGVHMKDIKTSIPENREKTQIPDGYKKLGQITVELIKQELELEDVKLVDPLPTTNDNTFIDYSKIKTDILVPITISGEYFKKSTGMFYLHIKGGLDFIDVKTKESIGGITGYQHCSTVQSNDTKVPDTSINTLVREIPPNTLLQKFLSGHKDCISRYLQNIKESEIPKE